MQTKETCSKCRPCVVMLTPSLYAALAPGVCFQLDVNETGYFGQQGSPQTAHPVSVMKALGWLVGCFLVAQIWRTHQLPNALLFLKFEIHSCGDIEVE